MYLTRSHRFIFWLAAVPLLIFAALAGVALLEARPTDKSGRIAVLIVIVALTACPVAPLLAYYLSGADNAKVPPPRSAPKRTPAAFLYATLTER